MGYSNLVSKFMPAHKNNYQKGRGKYKICKITPHHMAVKITAERCGELFQNPKRYASSNYGIGYDGEIYCYVDEDNRAYTSSNKENDCQAITIEVANSKTGGDWPISEASWNSLVNLCVDICRRHGFRLEYTNNPNGSLTRHNMFKATTCPGPYLQSRFPELAQTVNRMLDKEVPAKTTNYYPKCTSVYKSIVDALKSIKVDSSFANRRKIAKANGIKNYLGTAKQNVELLRLLKAGKLKKA